VRKAEKFFVSAKKSKASNKYMKKAKVKINESKENLKRQKKI